jgi:hemoglobin
MMKLHSLGAVALLPLVLLACGGDKEEETSDDGGSTDDGTAGEEGTGDDATGDDATGDEGTADDATGGDDAEGGDDGATGSLYEQLGGADAVNALIAEFVVQVSEDPEINWFFVNADIPRLGGLLHDQICAATGGGCEYTGLDMATAHAGMGITDAQFNAMVADLLKACDNLGIPYALDGSQPIDPLLLALVDMQSDIVTDPDGSLTYFNQIGTAYGAGNGFAAINVVIAEFLEVVAADSRINGFFASTDLAVLGRLLVEQVCEATGGYCTYSGQDMCAAHEGMGVTDEDFNALVEDLLTALTNLGVPWALDGSELIDPLLLALAGMQGQVTGADCP